MMTGDVPPLDDADGQRPHQADAADDAHDHRHAEEHLVDDAEGVEGVDAILGVGAAEEGADLHVVGF